MLNQTNPIWSTVYECRVKSGVEMPFPYQRAKHALGYHRPVLTPEACTAAKRRHPPCSVRTHSNHVETLGSSQILQSCIAILSTRFDSVLDSLP